MTSLITDFEELAKEVGTDIEVLFKEFVEFVRGKKAEGIAPDDAPQAPTDSSQAEVPTPAATEAAPDSVATDGTEPPAAA